MWQELGQHLVKLTDAPFPRILFSLAVAVAVALVDIVVGAAADQAGYTKVDAFAVGVSVFFLTYLHLTAVNERRQQLLREVLKVAELNHQVRNALQSIRYAAHLGTDTEYVNVIDHKRGTNRRGFERLISDCRGNAKASEGALIVHTN